MTLRFLRSTLLALGLCLLVAVAAVAAPAAPVVGPFIEDYPSYQGQTRCSPWAKPGVVAFQQMVLAAYPDTGAGSIGRDCSVGGTSEHKEGRAWDWGVNVGMPAEKAAADDMLKWLAQKDIYGTDAAMARRLGVMYAIWNKRIWFPSSGWHVYCVQRDGACRDPDDGGIRHPHTDHVHFSFTWLGARKKTTYWKKRRSLAWGGSETAARGVVVVGGNGGVRTFGDAGYYGSKSSGYLKRPAVAIESTPGGDGYWILTKKGRVFGFGAARSAGWPTGIVATDLTSTSTGAGYWVLGRDGGIFAFGDAATLAATSDAVEGTATAIATTPSGAGYWVLHDSGAVESYGDAEHHGDAQHQDETAELAVDLAPTPSGLGYWIVTSSGRVEGFGDAATFGDLSGSDVTVVAILPTSSGDGYRLVTDRAGLYDFGDATPLPSNAAAATAVSFERFLGHIEE